LPKPFWKVKRNMAEVKERCPSWRALAGYSLQRLAPAQANTVARHLEHCPECRAKLAGTPTETFLAVLNSSVAESAVSAAWPTLPGLPGAPANPSVTAPPLPPVRSLPDDQTTTAAASPDSGAPLGLPPELMQHPKYRIVRALGQGGMGTVYQADHLVMGRTVALKVINSTLLGHPDALPRFLTEVRAAARLDHPNIVKAYDADNVGQLQMFVMEFVEGTTLDRLLAQQGPLPVKLACLYGGQAALGLQHAHEKGLAHRDIKPSNLIVSNKGQVKILDFGLVKLTGMPQDQHLTQTGAYMGTAGYVAPEQAMNAGKADIRSDIYSLGCVIYHLLAGRPPFRADTLLQTIMAHVNEPPPSLLEVRPDIPEALWQVLTRMLAKDPAQRFQTPLEVARALQPFVHDAHRSHAPSAVPPAQATAPTSPLTATVPVALPVARKATPSPAEQDRQTRKRRWWVAGVVAVMFLLGVVVPAAVVLRVQAPKGTLVLEIEQPGAEVLVDGNKVKIQEKDGREIARIEVTDEKPHQLKVTNKDGFTIYTREFTIKDAKAGPIKVALVPKEGDLKGPGQVTNSLGMKLVRLPGGTFTMGSRWGEQDRDDIEEEHEVAVSEFYIGETETTQKQFRDVLGYNPSYFSNNARGKEGIIYGWIPGEGKDRVRWEDTESFPVENVSWNEASEFCKKLTALDTKKPEGWVYRLPREAEWEYACRGGARAYQTFHFSNRISSNLANFDGTHPYSGGSEGVYLERTTRVGSYREKAPHPFGLADMHGNVAEWCADWFDKDYYRSSPRKDPSGPAEGSNRVSRGGSWSSRGQDCRSANRDYNRPGYCHNRLGFRVVLVPAARP
jgi:serine/threonine protein kinase/formylglycine-generating enzyme required for sulfatase activity